MDAILRAAKLEFNQLTESKANLLLLLLIPISIVFILGLTGSNRTPWNENIRYFDFFSSAIFPTLVLFISIQLAILRIVAERAPLGTLDRDILAIGRANMFLGKFATNMVFGAIQVVLIFTVGFYLLSLFSLGNPFSVLLILLSVSFVGVSMGLCFSVFAKTKEQAVQLVPFTILVFLLLSGFMIKIEEMPSVVAAIAWKTPLALSSASLVSLMFEGKIMKDVFENYAVIVVWGVTFLIVGLAKFYFEKK